MDVKSKGRRERASTRTSRHLGHCHGGASANQRRPTKTQRERGLDAQPPEDGHKPEAPSRKGGRDVDVLLQDGEREHKAPPQGSLNKG